MYCAVPENITIVIVKTSYPLPTNGIKNSRGMGDSSRPKKKNSFHGGHFLQSSTVHVSPKVYNLLAGLGA